MSEEVTINGNIFYIDRLNAFKQLEVFGDLQKDLLPALGGLMNSLGGEGETEAALTESLTALSQNLTGKQLKYWCDRLLTKDSITVETDEGVRKLDQQTQNLVFSEFTDILELLYHVLRVNFSAPLANWANRIGLDLTEIPNLAQSEDSATAPSKSS